MRVLTVWKRSCFGRIRSLQQQRYFGTSRISCRTRPSSSSKNDEKELTSAAYILLSISAAAVPLLVLYADNNSASCDAIAAGCDSPAEQDAVLEHTDKILTPNWVTESSLTKARCSTHTVHQANHGKDINASGNINNCGGAAVLFDPARSQYYEIQLAASSDRESATEKQSLSPPTTVQATDPNAHEIANGSESLPSESSILHNTIVVLPNLLSAEECELMVTDAERILEEKAAKNIEKGCKTESWTVYSSFGHDSQRIMDRVLEKSVLEFIELRLSHVACILFRRNDYNMVQKLNNNGDERAKANNTPVPKGMPMNFYWDDPVVIKYVAGNLLAPHEDMRELTIVVPLNPLGEGKFPLDGGGTRFWLEGTTPEVADSNGGISVKPTPGSGIIFNGKITHSGNSVLEGTRFVLMTSITLDDDTDYTEDDDYEEENVTCTE